MKKYSLFLIIPSLLISSCSEVKQKDETPLISLYDENSKLYLGSVENKDNIYSLRTYHHKDYDDVPFVDFNEYHYGIKSYLERNRKFYQGNNEHTFIYSRVENNGKIVFDTLENTVTFNNASAILLDSIGTNNGIDGDITNNNIKIYTSSEKTKVLEEGKDVVIDLDDYNMDIVSQDRHLYVPINVINTLLLAPTTAGICFNGVDYFTDYTMRNRYISVFARSGNYNSSWIFTPTEVPTAFKRVENVESDEKYRFEGIYSNSTLEKPEVIVFSLFKDHKGTMNGNIKNNIHFAFEWSEDNDVINLKGAQTMMESRDLDDATGEIFYTKINKRATNYATEHRSEAVAKMNYDELRLSFDYLYGLKEKLDVNKLIEENPELKERLLSTNIMEYEDAFDKLVNYYIDDIHSSINGGESIYSSSPIPSFLTIKNGEYQGNRNKAYYSEVGRLGTMKNNSHFNSAYEISGKTAYLKFHLFIHTISSSFPMAPINSSVYKTETHEQAQQKVLSALNYSPYYAFCVAFNDILKHTEIENIVFDLTGNIGGEIRCFPYLAAFMSKDPNIVYRNTFDNTLVDLHYKVDLNGDNVFGGEGDSFEGKYKFYILNGANFSAGNEFAAFAKDSGCAKLIGEKSAGGSCAIANRVDSSGLTYKLSSTFHLQLKQGDKYISNDDGVDIDYQIPFENWYELDQLDAFLNTLSN